MGRTMASDPLQNFRFKVEIEGIADMGFTKVDGLDVETEVTEYAEGGYTSVHKLPGREKTGKVSLETGATSNMALYNWYKLALTDQQFRKTVTIIEQDRLGNTVRSWVLLEAWANKFTAPSKDAKSNDVSIDKIELEFEELG